MTSVPAFALVPPALSLLTAAVGPAIGEFMRRHERDHWDGELKKLAPVSSTPAAEAPGAPVVAPVAAVVPPTFEPEEIAARSAFAIDESQSLFAILIPAFGAFALRNEGPVVPLTLAGAAIVAVIVVAVVLGRQTFAATWSWPNWKTKTGIRAWWRYSFVGVATLGANVVAAALILKWG